MNMIINKLFAKKEKNKEKPLTYINRNRKESNITCRNIVKKNERQVKSCLSKYFENIVGLNSAELKSCNYFN